MHYNNQIKKTQNGILIVLSLFEGTFGAVLWTLVSAQSLTITRPNSLKMEKKEGNLLEIGKRKENFGKVMENSVKGKRGINSGIGGGGSAPIYEFALERISLTFDS